MTERRCPQCGAECAPAAKFCAACGTALAAAAVGDLRKMVTVLFCDLVGSTELVARLDPETLRGVMELYFARVSDVIRAHGGTVEKYIGDAVVAVFGVPVAHEDDAVRGCRAALGIHDAVAGLATELSATQSSLGVRIGIETGDTLVGDPARGSTFASGPPVNTAARLEQVAGRGEVLLGPGCRRLVQPWIEGQERPGLTLKGFATPIDAFLLAEVRDTPRPTREPTYVGRHDDLSQLTKAFQESTIHRSARLVTVLGGAGMGKSRLAGEFIAALPPDVLVLRGRCLPYGERVTYWPLVEIVRQAATLSGGESPQEAGERIRALIDPAEDATEVTDGIAGVIGHGDAPVAPAEMAWALRRLFEELSRIRPVVIVVDDLHWADPGLVSLVAGLHRWLHASPVMVLGLARPEFLDDHPHWSSTEAASTVTLAALDAAQVGRLASDRVGGPVDAPLVHRIEELSGGNPLYVEHLLSMWIEDAVVVEDGGTWRLTDQGRVVDVPASITALLGARLDRLPAAERAVLGPASVMGQVFFPAMISLLSIGADEGDALAALIHKGLVSPTGSDLPGQEALRFAHVLLRDVAYRSLTKATRAMWHEHYARWMEEVLDGPFVDDLVGGQLEIAFHTRLELGPPDDAARALGREGSRRLETAARSLLAVDDGRAIGLLARAAALSMEDDGHQRLLHIERAIVTLRDASPPDPMRVLMAEVAAQALAAGELARHLQARALETSAIMGAGGEWELDAAVELATSTEAEGRRVGDQLGVIAANVLRTEICGFAYDLDGIMAAHLAISEALGAAGRERESTMYAASRIVQLLTGSTPALEGLAEARRSFERVEGHQYRSMAAAILGSFLILVGEDGEGQSWWELAAALAREVPDSVAGAQLDYCRAEVALSTADWVEAARRLPGVIQDFSARQAWSIVSTLEAEHAISLLHTGQVDAARDCVARALKLGSEQDVATQSSAHAARAWIAALDGDRAAVLTHAEASLLVPPSALLQRALMEVTCAEAMWSLGERGRAHAHRQAGVQLYERKGNLVAAARHRALLDPT